MTPKRSKEDFRKICRERLQRASMQSRYRRDKTVVSKLYEMIKRYRAQTVMLYLPLSIEVDISLLLQRLRREKRVVLVPFMEGKSFRLVKYRYPLQTKRFGIKEPKYSRQYRRREIDIAVVPIIGMDSTCRRIGFGKGMYDRFFEKEMKNIKSVVFVARELCYAKEVITDHYDVKADHIIVP